jgi:hypothetical protein
MPISPATAATPPLGPGAPKLRSCCDGCGTAKVKCDRTQPQCGRCISLGLACIYGLSRQFGKPRRKRPANDVEATARCKKLAVHIDESRNSQKVLSYAQSQEIYGSGQFESNNVAIDTSSFTFGLTNLFDTNEQDEFSPSFFNPSFLDEWPQPDHLGNGPEILSVSHTSATENRLQTSALQPVNSARMGASQHRSHSCPRESYEIFRDLICLSPDLHAPEADSDPVSAQLDQVLRCTRNAIDRLARLLRCPCARSGHRIMVHASIISRMLLWYQQAAGWTCSNTWPSRTPASIDSSSANRVSSSSASPHEAVVDTEITSTPTLAQSTGFVVEHVPVSVGTFSIEDQNVQAAFRDQLVLSELKKTGSLIDLLTSQESRGSSTNGIADLHTTLGAWLRSEHSRTVRILTTRLSALNAIL